MVKFEEVLKDVIELRKVDVYEMRIIYESELSVRNNEIFELKRILNDLLGIKEEIFVLVEKLIESRFCVKDVEVMWLCIWFEEVKKLNV